MPVERPGSIIGLVASFLRANPDKYLGEMLDPLALYAGTMPIEEFDLTAYVAHLKSRNTRQTYGKGDKAHTPKRGLSPQTIRKYATAARRVLKFAKAQRWLREVPDLPPLPKIERNPRDIDPAVLTAALKSLRPAAAAIVRFIVAVGCRPGEACGLTWEAVDLRTATARLRSKGRWRTLYLTPQAIEVLNQVKHRTGTVFLSQRGGAYTASGLRSTLRRHGIGSTYSLRHTAAQFWLEHGFNLGEVAKQLGHVDLRIVQTYAQIRDRQARETAARLPSPLDATSDHGSLP